MLRPEAPSFPMPIIYPVYECRCSSFLHRVSRKASYNDYVDIKYKVLLARQLTMSATSVLKACPDVVITECSPLKVVFNVVSAVPCRFVLPLHQWELRRSWLRPASPFFHFFSLLLINLQSPCHAYHVFEARDAWRNLKDPLSARLSLDSAGVCDISQHN